MDQSSRNRLARVHPELAKRVEKTIDSLAAAGLDVRVVQGLRTYAEQNALFDQGRTRKGPKVTNARGGQSNHNFGLAVDLCPFDDGVPDWNNERGFMLIGAAGKAQGLEWGGDWTSFPDRPHLQLRTGLKTAVCHELFVEHGLAGVWKEASRRIGIAPVPTPLVTQIAAAEPHTAVPPTEQPAATGELRGNAAIEPTAIPPTDIQPPPPAAAPTVVVDAPPKEGSTEQATKVTILGLTVPTAFLGVVTAIKSAISDGYVSASQIGEVLINFISSHQRFVFAGLGMVLGGMMLKKLYKQITLWLQMYFAARKDMNNVTVKPQ